MENQEYHIEEQLQEGHWWFRGRRQLLDSLIAKLVQRDGRRHDLILDVGCGVGNNYRVLKPYADRVVGLDPDGAAVEYSQRKGYDDVLNVKLEDELSSGLSGKADIVVAMDVLEHLPDDALGAKRISDYLKSGGHAIITVPAYGFLFGKQDEVGHHFRRYRFKTLSKIMSEGGLKLVRWSYFNTLLFAPIVAVRLLMRFWWPKSLQSENQINSPWINAILTKLFSWEIWSITVGMSYPFGVSMLVVVKKESKI